MKAHLEVDTEYVVPLARAITQFRMPGRVIPDCRERSALLASEHVFGPEQFYQDVVEVVCSFWDVDNLAPTQPEAQTALAQLNRYRAVLRRLADRRSASPAVSSRSDVS